MLDDVRKCWWMEGSVICKTIKNFTFLILVAIPSNTELKQHKHFLVKQMWAQIFFPFYDQAIKIFWILDTYEMKVWGIDKIQKANCSVQDFQFSQKALRASARRQQYEREVTMLMFESTSMILDVGIWWNIIVITFSGQKGVWGANNVSFFEEWAWW